MKRFLLVWACLALYWSATAQSATPLPLRAGFLNFNEATHTVALDTIPHAGTAPMPCQVAYVGAYVLTVNGIGNVDISVRDQPRSAFRHVFRYAPNNSWGLADVPRCSSVHGDKIVFVSITDGYVQPKRYNVVELSLGKEAFVRHYRSRAPVCATYSADGTHILVEAAGQQQMVRSAY
jgi:hypothetical protein